MAVRNHNLSEKFFLDVEKLTDNTGVSSPDSTIENCGDAVTGVDGTGSNAASKSDVDTRLTAIENNIADLAAKYNAILDRLKADV